MAGRSSPGSRRRPRPSTDGAAGQWPGEWQGHARDRPHGVAVRAARARLPAQDPRRGREQALADGEPLRVVGDEWGTPTLRGRRGRRDRGAPRRGCAERHPSPRQRRRRDPRDVGRGRPRPVSASRMPSGVRAGTTWARASMPPALGRARADAPPRRRAACGRGRRRWPITRPFSRGPARPLRPQRRPDEPTPT